jgi:hypothetical protein
MTNKRLLAVLAAGAVATSIASSSGPVMGAGSGSNPLVGSWQRTNSCAALVRAMRGAHLAERLQRESLVGAGYFRSASEIDPAAPCKRAHNLKHSHFFTTAGGFGSRDEKGNQVDDGDYKITAPHTLAFPSHARDFGYRIKVRYRIKAGKLRFNVIVPRPCTGKCQGATAWALSAFYSGPAFRRGN